MRLVITRAAARDLAEIEAFIARDSARAARRFVLKLLDACEGLVDQPRAYPEAGVQNLRKRPLDDYLIFYRISEAVEVVRILHAARDWARLLDPATD
ncbi:type II toxin-antitoxin system RelE/ParE family toxin [Brevundimonas sp. SL130]|uniref:type II toxin-antitoxin system RelE/ParE family toxin n=1 Tax=Brevundimonas sp. SL130 TaxID=2995143 RepID=UPI00226CE432|nr:type II toxin-antitoxin system RelE/ParE family toxin [Brevundimonas sp. SL130]WAC60511.1 type II toxin-antitoxin system RelE/ParE family toxin [Brevundimonas sp. SL130]